MSPRTWVSCVVIAATMSALPAASAGPRPDLYGDPLPDGAIARVGTIRLRNVGEIQRLALSPDGKVLVTAANGYRPLRVWDAATGALVREVLLPPDETATRPAGRQPPESVAAVAFAADPGRLHVLTNSGAIRAYDLAAGTWTPPLARTGAKGARTPTSTGWASADGKHFAFAARVDGWVGVEVFAVGADAPVARIEDPDLGKWGGPVSMSENADRIAGVVANGAARVWDVKTSREVATHRPPRGVFYSVAISPDGKELAGVCGPEKRVPEPPPAAIYLYGWNLDSGKECFRVPSWDGRALTYTPDGRRLVGFGQRDVLVADAATGKLAHRLQGHGAWAIFGHSFGAGGKRLATGGRDHTAITWDLESGKVALDFDSPRGPVDVLAFSQDAKTLFTACRGDHIGGLWAADTGKRLHRLVTDGKGGPMSAVFTPDGRHLVTGYGQWGATSTGNDWAARLWGVADGKLVRAYGGHTNGVHLVALSPDGKTLATREYAKAVRLWSLGSGELTGEFDWVPYNVAAAIAFDSTGALIGAGYEGDQGTGVADLISRKALTRWAGGRPRSLVLSPDGRLLAVTESDGPNRSVVLLNVGSGAVVQTLTGLRPGIGLVCFSADGGTVAVTEGAGGVTADDIVRLFDVKTGKERQAIRGHKGLIAGITFSPDGTRLATGGWDSTALVWDLQAASK